jgi:hypothetical protein
VYIWLYISLTVLLCAKERRKMQFFLHLGAFILKIFVIISVVYKKVFFAQKTHYLRIVQIDQ